MIESCRCDPSHGGISKTVWDAEKTGALSHLWQCGFFFSSQAAHAVEVIEMKKKPNLNRAGTMDIDSWRSRQVSKRLHARLSEQSRAFEEKHGGDTDEELREYVRRKAVSLRRMPHPLELPGGAYLAQRLGDWDALARSLHLPPVSQAYGDRLYRSFRQREAEAFAEERRARKRELAQKQAQNAAKMLLNE